jgi:hypothetical protein
MLGAVSLVVVSLGAVSLVAATGGGAAAAAAAAAAAGATAASQLQRPSAGYAQWGLGQASSERDGLQP